MKMHQQILVATSALALLLPNLAIASDDDDRKKKVNKNISAYSLVTRMAKSMGGIDKILAFEGIEFNATGSLLEPEQSHRPGGEFIQTVNYDYKISNSFTAQQSRTEWLNDIVYAFKAQRQFSEVINGNNGAVFGFDTFIAPPQAPMLNSRLGARVKQNLVSSPLALIHRASQLSNQLKFLGTEKFNDRRHLVVSIPGYDQAIRVFIDTKTKLPSKVETLEDDTVYGDTLWEVEFSNWVEVEGVKVPSTLTHKINNRIINNEVRSAFDLKQSFDPQLFSIPTDLIVDFNADQFAWGVRMSQWFNRLVALGIPFDLDQRTAATLNIVEVAPKVFHVRALTHHSMVTEMDDYLIVTEAPLYNERSEVVINALKQRWPNKPIKYLVVSHFHNDHIGGVRAYGAIGATIIIGDQTKDHFEAIFKAKHTVFPDSYALNPVDVEFKVVETSEDFVLSDGKRTVTLFDVKNRHSIGAIATLVEDAGLVFVSDLYNPELFPSNIPQDFLGWAEDLLNALQPNTRNIKLLVGGHGDVNSYQDFVTQVEASLK